MKRENMGTRNVVTSSSSLPCSPQRRYDLGMEDENPKSMGMKETPRDAAWERRRRQILRQERRRSKSEDLTDEDLKELKGSIELGFGFKEEQGQKLCNTLPALDFYFAVNRQTRGLTMQSGPSILPRHKRSYSASALSTNAASSSSSSSSQQFLKICNPGDDPEQVKTKLRHWAQAVGCSVKQTY